MSKNSTSAMPASVWCKVQVTVGSVIFFAALTLSNFLIMRFVCPTRAHCSLNHDEFHYAAAFYSLVFILCMVVVAGILRCLSPCFLFFGHCVRGTVIVSRRLAKQEELDF